MNAECFAELSSVLKTSYAKRQIHRQSLMTAVRANQHALEISRQYYRSGLADFLNVLESERSLYQTQDALVQSELAVSLDVVAVHKARESVDESEQSAGDAGRFPAEPALILGRKPREFGVGGEELMNTSVIVGPYGPYYCAFPLFGRYHKSKPRRSQKP